MISLPVYLLAAMTLIVTPGPDFIYVLSRGIADGKRSGIISAAGVAAGILVHTTTTALGLAVLVQTSAAALWALKLIGGVYLIYLGVHLLRDKTLFDLPETGRDFDLRQCFVQGFLSNVLNPKVALFFVAFLPQFVSENSAHDSARYSLHIVGLGLIYAALTISFLALLGMFAGGIGAWLNRQRRAAGSIRAGAGIVLVLLGLRLMVPERA